MTRMTVTIRTPVSTRKLAYQSHLVKPPHRLPPWLSVRKQKLVNHLTKKSPKDQDREMRGIIAEDDTKVFPAAKIDQLFARPTFRIHDKVDNIFVAIDPNTGQNDRRESGGSDFAVASMCYSHGRMILMGMEMVDAHEPTDYLGHLTKHLTQLRDPVLNPSCASATIVLIIECNLGMEASWLLDYINKRFKNVEPMNETELRTGVPTTAPLKREMALKLKGTLQMGAMYIADTFVCSSMDPEDALDRLKDQFGAYSEIRTPSNDPLKPPSSQFSGKKGGARDDGLIAVQLARVWSEFAMVSPKYSHLQ